MSLSEFVSKLIWFSQRAQRINERNSYGQCWQAVQTAERENNLFSPSFTIVTKSPEKKNIFSICSMMHTHTNTQTRSVKLKRINDGSNWCDQLVLASICINLLVWRAVRNDCFWWQTRACAFLLRVDKKQKWRALVIFSHHRASKNRVFRLLTSLGFDDGENDHGNTWNLVSFHKTTRDSLHLAPQQQQCALVLVVLKLRPRSACCK